MGSRKFAEILTVAYLLVAIAAFGQPRRGYDITGLAAQDVTMIAAEIDPGSAVGALQGTFGDALPAFETLARTGKIAEFRLHLLNGTCYHVNPNRCEKGEPSLSDDGALASRAARFAQFCALHPGVECEASPVLEYDERNPARVQHWIAVVKKAAPGVGIVLSPSGVGAKIPGYLIESHGNQAHGDIISNDGESLFDSSSSNYCNGARKTCFGWIPRGNRRLGSNWVPPSKRPAAWALRQQDVRQMVLVMRPVTPQPAMTVPGCGAVRALAGKELWKTNAEEGPTGSDPRWAKPLIIWNRMTDRAPLVSPAGNEVGCVKRFNSYLPYGPGWQRAYVGTCSGDTPISLYRKNGGEWLFLKDGKLCILVNAIRREGTFK